MNEHNPAQIDPSIIGPNHRLLTQDELSKPLPEGAEWWSPMQEEWVSAKMPAVNTLGTYRIPSERPKVVCLCGSSKWPDVHHRVMMEETLAGRIVIPMGLYGHADYPPGAKSATNDGDEATEVKQMLDSLHHAKIDLADEILVVNVEGYIGSSTKREIEHAEKTGKTVRYLEPPTTQSIPWTLETHPDVVLLTHKQDKSHRLVTRWYIDGVYIDGHGLVSYMNLHSEWLQRNGEPAGEKVTTS